MSTTKAATETLVQDAQRLGITWGRRPGTVVATGGVYSALVPAVLLDGDTDTAAAIPAASLSGPLSVGMRVMVDTVPSPSGPPAQHVAGVISPEGPWAAAATTSSATVTAEAVVLTATDVVFRPGGAYRVRAGSAVIADTTALCTYGLRLGSLTGTLVGEAGKVFGGSALVAAAYQWTGYVANTGTAVVRGDVVLTLTITGAGGVHYGAATLPRYLDITYAGAAADHPQAVAVS